MAVSDITPRLRELGRIRLGDTVPVKGKGDKTRPVKLETFRFTSPFRNLIEVAAKLYGGEVEEWKNAPTEGQQWQVTTETNELAVLIPPSQDPEASLRYELWSGGGRQRLCDGITEGLKDVPCLCDPSNRECKPRLQLLLLLPQLPDLGVWRLVTQSVFAAMEIPAVFAIFARVHEAGGFPAATLRIDQRTSKTDGTRHYAVPVLEIDYTLADAGLLPTKTANAFTGEIVSPALAAGEQPVVDAVSGEGASAAGGTSDGEARPGEAPEAAVAARSASGASDRPKCLHVNGSETHTMASGKKVERCVDCKAILEDERT
ncbi:MAG: hypothetical protein M3P18_13715 [Actinomycetota bacterium]|nr:hypothetical protein [Actinomycetota bacterium]